MNAAARTVLRHWGGILAACWALTAAPAGAAAPLSADGSVDLVDPTPPVITPSLQGTAGANGWYVSALTISWSVSDPDSGITETNGCDTKTFSQDSTDSVTCSATNGAGLIGAYTFSLRVDVTPPSVTGAEPARAADANGWYNRSVEFAVSGADATSGVDTCPGVTYDGPDRADASVTGTCRDVAGNVASRAFSLSYDATPPAVSAGSPARAADANGWYNRPVSFSFDGSDATSGIDACPAVSYSGPDGAAASVTGTCRDVAGNLGSRAFSLAYDATAPTVSGAAAARSPDANGWYNRPVSFAFSGTDATAGVEACSTVSYSGPDSSSASVSGTCSDRAGNTSAPGQATLRYDATAPTVTGMAADRSPDRNGWYNRAVGFTLTASDATAGVDSCGSSRYNGPDGASVTATGACTDRAGNSASRSFGLKYDATAPAVTASADRPPNQHGWHNHAVVVSFAGTDATSGLDSCAEPVGYAGPDTVRTTVSGSCRDLAGNVGTQGLVVRYDATAPAITAARAERGPDLNGWYNRPVGFTVEANDPMSGIDVCPPASYDGPDGDPVGIDAFCRDRAGNAATRRFTLRYDATAPGVRASPDRPPDAGAWYNRPVVFTFSGSDATSGLGTCSPPATYSGPDAEAAIVSGTCRDAAGNVGSLDAGLAYDSRPPTVTAVAAQREPDRNGWFNRPVRFAVAGTDETSGIASCGEPAYAGPDSAQATVTGTCRDRAGNTGAVASAGLKYDSTGPVVTGVDADRPPDANGWYNRPVTLTLAGTDALAGLEGCSSARYEGPDGAGALAGGWCRDLAGNETAANVRLDYDATPPVVEAVAGRRPDRHGWYSRPVQFTFTGSDETSGVVSCSDPVLYRAPRNGSAEVSGACRDRAGNEGTGAAGFRYADRLVLPTPGARVGAPPRVTWVDVVGATLYNVQVWKAGKKILSVWPRATRFQVRARWRFAGKAYRLAPGRYDVFVWPRVGARYGALLGRTWFVRRGG